MRNYNLNRGIKLVRDVNIICTYTVIMYNIEQHSSRILNNDMILQYIAYVYVNKRKLIFGTRVSISGL